MVRERIRIRFSKTGNLCFIGHRDLLTTLERLFRRARLPIARSQGFHPKLRMSFPSALPLGVAGEDEVLELEFRESIDPNSLLKTLNRCTVEGLAFLTASPLAEGEKKALLRSSVYEASLPPELRSQTSDRIARVLAATTWPIEKHNGKTVDLRPLILEMCLDSQNGLFRAQLLSTQGPDAGIRELFNALDLGKEMFLTLFPVRKACVLES